MERIITSGKPKLMNLDIHEDEEADSLEYWSAVAFVR